jgi:hypothetical protein
VPKLLASEALWNVILIHPQRFYEDNFVLLGHYIIDVFVVVSWFQIHEKEI